MKLTTCAIALLVCFLFFNCSTFAQLSPLNPTASVDIPTLQYAPFFSDLEVKAPPAISRKIGKKEAPQQVSTQKSAMFLGIMNMANTTLESLLPMQFKYAIMLNTTVESIKNVWLYKSIDDWFGTRYRFGGTSKKGIDCSAFMQVLALYGFGMMLPRTAHEQYSMMEKINNGDLKEGDFVFFNTRGGVSHVGMYLGNNKFVHSSTSNGVAISDLADSYWSVRFIGGKRMTGNLIKTTN